MLFYLTFFYKILKSELAINSVSNMLIETTETKNIESKFLEFDISIASLQITYKNSRIFS